MPSSNVLPLTFLCALVFGCAPAASPAGSGGPAAACAGMSDAEVTSTLETVRTNVESVHPKSVTDFESKGAPAQKLVGAVVQVRATPGMSGPWLTRVLRCDGSRAREACTGSGHCPLVVEGADVEAGAESGSFAIAIESRDPNVAREILSRAEQLASTR